SVAQPVLLASPGEVLTHSFALCRKSGFLASVWFSFSRIAAGFLSALAAGCLLALLSARFGWAETLLYPYMVTVKSVPVASFIVVALIWFSASALSGFISFLIALPVVYTNMLAGLRSVEKEKKEMATVFRLSFFRKLRYIYLPALSPHLLSASSVAAGLAVKSGIAAEVIGIPPGSLGLLLRNAKIYLETADLFAVTLVIVVVGLLAEKSFTGLLRTVLSRLTHSTPKERG
ncbi:MAG: ABC transporter permease subunit, partial [Clostridia bacterium]|nr:ABC transporter permease subunit [Clostridia bacterium]